MPRINIEDELWTDSRFMILAAQVGEEKAIGQLVRFWRVAQQFYKQDKKPIPHQIFKSHKLSHRIVTVGLADVSDEGIFAVDSEKHFGWLIGRVKGGETRKGNKNNGVSNANSTRPRDESQVEPNAKPMPLTPTLTPTLSLTQNTVNTGIQVTTPSKVEEAVDLFELKPKDDALKITDSQRVWQFYEQAYVMRYKMKPVRNAMVNGQIKNLVARLGKDAPYVAEFFVKHNKSFYVEKCHPMGLCLADAEALHTQWVRGRAVTRTEAQQVDKTQSNINAWDQAARMVAEMKKNGGNIDGSK